MASAGGDGGDKPPRMPKDMKGLMKFCLQQTQSEDPTSSSHFDQMPEEKKQFLENALKDMSVNPVEQMKKCIDVVKTEGDSEDGIENKLTALNELIEWAEEIDFAIDFHKIGGLELFPLMMNHDETELRSTFLKLVGTMVQNNPYCQAAVVRSGRVPDILSALDKDQNPTVKSNALYAVSCLCRDSEEAQKVFLDNDGFSVLMRAMQTDVEKLKIKSSFLLSNICTDKPAYKDILCDIGMIDQLIGHLNEDHALHHEHLMSALLSIVSGHGRAIAECQRSEFNLPKLLQDRIQLLEGKEEYQEEREYASNLLHIITSEQHGQDAEAR